MAVILLPLNLFWLILLIRRWLISRDQFINWIQATLLSATAFGRALFLSLNSYHWNRVIWVRLRNYVKGLLAR